MDREAAKVASKTTILRDKLMTPSSLKNLMSSGKTSLDFKMPKMHLKRQSFSQSDSKRFLQEAASLGKEFCCTVLQVQEKPSWPKPVPLKLKEHSSQCLLLI